MTQIFSPEVFLQLEQVSVLAGGNIILDNLELTIHHGEQWAVTGPSGSGKTVLAHALLGSQFHTGRICYRMDHRDQRREGRENSPIGGGGNGEWRPKMAFVEQQHHFRNKPGTTTLYYQQRFNASDADQTITVAQELESYGGRGERAGWEFADLLHIRPLFTKPLIQLSNGENKRVQLAIALMEDPEMLILDNPLLGLDAEGRATLHAIINQLAGRGIKILFITTSRELPECITHVAQLDQGKWTFTGPRGSFRPVSHAGPGVQFDPALLTRLRGFAEAAEDFSFAVKMSDVTIKYGEATILNNVNWEVRKGEKWNLSGPNGAGKSTLLSLITADNPQAYANEIWLFDRRRGTGESIWEIKQKIGFVSPELHLYFEHGAGCFDVIASGLFDTIGLFRLLNQQQEEQTLTWMKLLSLESLRTKRLAELSTGQQRMVLLARALIKNPPLLILDEPCQGLDEEHTQYFRELIDRICEAFGTTLIYVSHYQQELPACIDRFLVLENGVVQS